MKVIDRQEKQHITQKKDNIQKKSNKKKCCKIIVELHKITYSFTITIRNI